MHSSYSIYFYKKSIKYYSIYFGECTHMDYILLKYLWIVFCGVETACTLLFYVTFTETKIQKKDNSRGTETQNPAIFFQQKF